MGYLTRDEMIEEVRDNLGGRQDVSEEKIIRALNLALQKISRRWDFRDLQRYAYNTLEIGESFIRTADEVREIYNFVLIDSGGTRRKLIRVPQRQWSKLFDTTTRESTSTPTHYTVWRSDLQLNPTPSDEFRVELRYTIWPTQFLEGSEYGTIKSEYKHLDDVIINFATAYLFKKLRQDVDSDQYLVEAQRELEDAVREDKVIPDEAIVPDGDIDAGGVGDYWKNPFVLGVR